ncbi:hypothetical protein WG902_04790 [Ramlibacter sp. PS3R-8]|uniref:hypothetical protein n=1 Tax=Ramlibacter sp. PS3R-8 TaxID=3133437 RepID=UPI0030B37E3F
MKLLLALRPCSPGLARRLAADDALARALGAKPNPAVGYVFSRFFDAGGPVLGKLLDLAEGEPVSFLRDMQCSPAELQSASHVEAVARSSVPQSRADSKATMAAYHQDSLHATSSRWSVRLPQRIYLSKAVAESAISHVDEWTGEYVLGAQAAQALRDSGLTGFDLRPVLHHKTGSAHDAGHHLVARELLPAALEDATIFETFDDGPRQPSTPRRYGFLSYAQGALQPSPDLARTAEPWGAWRTPVWIVRQRVRGWFESAQVRGWKFQPVLEEGTAPHGEHTQRWGDLLGRLRAAGASVVA